MVKPTSQKISSLELGRVLAMAAILLLHSQVLLTYALVDETPWLGYIVNQVCRFAVPFFFLLSGYLIEPKLNLQPFTTLSRYSRPLVKIWLVWSLICLAMPFNLQVVAEQGYLAERTGYWDWLMQTPLNSLLEGGLVHLWFIPGLLCALLIIATLTHAHKTMLILPLASALYVYGVLAGSYQEVTELSAPFFTRNGPFFSLLMVALGYQIRKSDFSISSAQALLLAAVGMCIHFAEAYWLSRQGIAFNIHDFLFGTPIWVVGIFMFLLAKPNLGQDVPWLFQLSSAILGIYVAHLPVIILMNNLAGALELSAFKRDAVIVIGSAIATWLLVEAIDRSKLKRLLLR